jgi:Skp family chaperone for outer membrane proteins
MKNQIFKFSSIIFSVSALTLAILTFSNNKKIAHFNYNEVYNNCSLKKRLEKDLMKITNVRKSEMDSLQLELSFISEKIQKGTAIAFEIVKYKELENRYLTFKQRYEEENIHLKETYFTQIRQEINDRAKEFAKDNGYDYLFSAVGDGALLYAGESDDITKDFQLYIK